jgi:hypothetical protein
MMLYYSLLGHQETRKVAQYLRELELKKRIDSEFFIHLKRFINFQFYEVYKMPILYHKTFVYRFNKIKGYLGFKNDYQLILGDINDLLDKL